MSKLGAQPGWVLASWCASLSAADERIADAVYADLAECAAALATSDRPTVGGSSI
jgi:hypothetical protein